MKSREWTIVWIVILVIVIVGLINLLIGCLNGSFRGKRWGVKKSSNVIFDTSYNVSEVANLEILSVAGDVRLEENLEDKIKVVVYGENAEDLSVDFRENRLKVDYSKYKHKNVFFGFYFYCNDITVYLPKNYANEIAIKANYGDIKAIDLESASMSIDADCGDISLGKVKNALIKNDYGNVKIESILNRAQIDLSCGDVKINSVNLAENSSIVNNFGDIKIGQTNEIYIDAKTSLGDLKIANNNRHSEITLKIENDCGDIKVGN